MESKSKAKIKSQKHDGRGRHPNSLDNLTYNGGRPTQYDSSKKTRSVTVTEEGWVGFSQLAKQHGCSSRSELVEKLGRGIIKLELSV
ncbi:hypothetical protein [Xenococcus sp. PCC 7305]|uniref:hypothetical protein n=1 Tax=Xenococcus sp. PCC 7305 TaxID=102125 RepID=UPI001EE74A79|nr:hypothetical protein [Xenococcus sp. PCC 7305]